VHRLRVAVLSVLNQKHHQEGNDRGSGVDDQLPGVGEMKRRPGDGPDRDDEQRAGESPRTPENARTTPREDAERVADHAKEIPFFFVFL